MNGNTPTLQPQRPNVTLIPANPALKKGGTHANPNQLLRTCAYARVSTDREEQESSYEAQIEYYTDKIMKTNGWTFAGIYADEGISGTQMRKRKDFLRMIRHCKKGKIDLIITKSFSRFARNTVDSLQTIRELKAMDIGVIFEKEGINTLESDSETIITLQSCMAQAESESISSNVKWGLRHAFSQGRVLYNYVFWYGYEKGEDGFPKIIPEQAEVVRGIYADYLAGQSIAAIVKRLNAKGILRKNGAYWSHSTLQNLLTNERYAGDALNQKTITTDCISKKVIKNRGELPQFFVKDAHAAIVDRSTFHLVQEELARRSGKRKTAPKPGTTGKSKYSSLYALTELLVCGECGSPYRRVTWAKRGKKRVVWRCSNRLDYGTKYCKESPTIDEDRLHAALTKAMAKFLSGREYLLDMLQGSIETALAASMDLESMAGLDYQKQQLEKAMLDLSATLVGASDENAFDAQFRKLSEEIQAIEVKKEEIQKECRERERLNAKLQGVVDTLKNAPLSMQGYDDRLARRLVDTVRVVSKERVCIMWKNGETEDVGY